MKKLNSIRGSHFSVETFKQLLKSLETVPVMVPRSPLCGRPASCLAVFTHPEIPPASLHTPASLSLLFTPTQSILS